MSGQRVGKAAVVIGGSSGIGRTGAISRTDILDAPKEYRISERQLHKQFRQLRSI